MSFNKKILALAIAGALPGSAFAVVDFNLGTGTVIYADEIVVPTVLSNAGQTLPPGYVAGILDLQTPLGFSIGTTTIRYIRLDFPGTTASPFTINPIPGVTVAPSVSGANFVILQITTDGVTTLPSSAVLQIIAPPTITTASKTPHSITYSLYETATQAVNNLPGTALSTKTMTWYNFVPGLELSCAPIGASKIDVSNPVKFADGTQVTGLFTMDARLTDVDPSFIFASARLANGTNVIFTDYFPAGSTIKVTGGFNFVNTLTINGFSAAIDPGFGFATWIEPIIGPLFTDLAVLTSNGTPMTPGDYSVLVTQGAGPVVAIPPKNLGVCARLAFSGSSDRIDFGLTPNATNKQFMRITNPATTGGVVNVSVWNDAGVKVDFPLSAVKVGAAPGVNLPATLNANSSTPLIDVNAFYAAAQSINGAFTVGAGVDGKPGKLRIEVRGAFGDDAVDGIQGIFSNASLIGRPTTGRLKNGIYIQAVSNGSFYQSH